MMQCILSVCLTYLHPHGSMQVLSMRGVSSIWGMHSIQQLHGFIAQPNMHFPHQARVDAQTMKILLAQLEFKSNGPLVQGTLVNEDISFEVLRIDAFSDSKERTCLSRVRILGSD